MITQQLKLNILDNVRNNLDKCSCIVGFDAFIDHITKHIKKRDMEAVVYFESLKEYAEFLMGKEDMSGSIEMVELTKKYGGNNPILSDALGKAGVKVVSIGAYGCNGINPIFSDLQKNCRLFGFTDPGECWSYEFTNNKIMNYLNMNGDHFTYQNIINKVGEGAFLHMADKAELLVLVNYSEQTNVLNIWKGLLEKTLVNINSPKKFFFDLSDCTRISDKYIQDCLEVMSEFRRFGKVYLSLNENEFAKLCAVCLGRESGVNCKEQEETMLKCLESLKRSISVDYIILRTLTHFYAVGDVGVDAVSNIVEKKPLHMTGVGDNQNAGICLGLMCDLSMKDSLILGVLYGNYYIKNGIGAGLEEVLGLKN